MGILIDKREGSYQLANVEPLHSLLRVCLVCQGSGCRKCKATGRELAQLDSGDVMISGNGPHGGMLIGIELKSIADLISSRATGRLQETQIPSMLRDYDERWLLTYTPYRCDTDGSLLTWRMVNGVNQWCKERKGGKDSSYQRFMFVESFRLSLTDVGFRCHHVDNLAQAALWIYGLYCKRQQTWTEQHRNLLEFDYTSAADRASRDERSRRTHVSNMPGSLDVKTECRAKMIACLPGMGYERALAVARFFPSTRAAFNAGPDAWAEVATTNGTSKRKQRIGPVVADAVEKMLT